MGPGCTNSLAESLALHWDGSDARLPRSPPPLLHRAGASASWTIVRRHHDVEIPRGTFARICSSSRTRKATRASRSRLSSSRRLAALPVEFAAHGLDAGEIIEIGSGSAEGE